MKKIVLLAFAVAIMGFVVTEPALSNTVVKPLYAGQTMYVGTVTVEHNGDLVVTYEIDEECAGVELMETHLHVSYNAPGATPAPPAHEWPITKKGMPKIGNFEHSGGNEFTIDLDDIPGEPGDIIYIAAHAVVGNGCCEICASADLEIIVSAKFDCCGINDESFFEVTITSGDDCIAEGVYLGWCADIDHSLSRGESGFYYDPGLGTEIDLKVYSTCSDEPLPPEILGEYGESGGIMYPDNLDLVNWILNNVAAGDLVDNDGIVCDTEPYTYGDIQGAIWVLLEGATFAEIEAQSGIGDISECRIGEIVRLAEAYGVGFNPGCCEVVAVILAPIPLPEAETPDIDTRQLVLIPVPAPCCETAWGDAILGDLFAPINPKNGKRDGSWATYFTHDLTEEDPS